jgi:alcohol dehydrogenase (cytochrome c)
MKISVLCAAAIAIRFVYPVCALAAAGPTQDELDGADEGTEWLLPNHDYAGTRYVKLNQIRPENASQLRPVCIYQASDLGRALTNPLVYRGVMYITTAQATVALDAASCDLKWRHDWKTKSKEALMAGVGSVYRSRGAALKDGYVIRSTSDGYLIALEADTGRVAWERQLVDAEKFEVLGMAPLVLEDSVIIGAGLSEFGVRGWIGAFQLTSGRPVWRFDAVPGPGQPGSETWSDPNEMARGGGGVWLTPTLDRATGSLYVATGNPVPNFHGDTRLGANLYTDSVIVLDAATGALKWYRQIVPHDLHDRDLTVTSPLYFANIAGRERAIVTVAGKDGYLRAFDRATREELFSVPVARIENADSEPTQEGVHVCPGYLGGVQWGPPALDPVRKSVFVPAVDWCGVFRKADELRYVHGQFYMGGSFTYDPIDKSQGRLTAVDASSGAIRWEYQSKRPMVAAVTATSGGVIFTGELTGHFLALDADNGRALYRFNVGAPVAGGVITYLADGKQYTAVVSGMVSAFWRAQPGATTIVVFGLP